MKLASVKAGILAALFGLITSVVIVTIGSFAFNQTEPTTRLNSPGSHGFVSGAVEYGNRK